MPRRLDARRRRGDFSARVRSIICDHKIDGEEWLETARLAHKLGFKSNADDGSTGTLRTRNARGSPAELRAVQDEMGGFPDVYPLAIPSGETRRWITCR